MSNPHVRQPAVLFGAPIADASLVVLAVHGRGQSPDFMRELALRIGRDDVAYVAPAAADGSWYPTGFLSPIADNEPSLGHALEAVQMQLDALLSDGISGERIVLLGFSQGACLLSDFILRTGARVAAALLHTGGYIGPDERTWPLAPDALADLRVLLQCARDDDWVPLHRVVATASALTAAGASVQLDVYDAEEHHINDDAVAGMRRLLRELAAPQRSEG